jgi:hypothetical protein
MIKVLFAVRTGKQDERGEDVYDPVLNMDPGFIHRWPQIGETVVINANRYEVLDVANDLDDVSVTYVVKVSED